MGDLIRIVIVDDHQVVIDGIKAMLQPFDRVAIAGQAHNGKEALDVIRILTPGLVLMDINMPVMDGIEACKIICKEFPDMKIIILSMLNEQSMVKRAIEKGAHGYVLKNEGRDELMEAIDLVSQGKKYFSEGIKYQGKDHHKSSGLPRISRREKQVLQLIVDEFTTKEIADKLFITQHTVDAHRKNLLMKLDARNTAGLVRMALEYGLLD